MAEPSLLDAMRTLLPADSIDGDGLERYAVDGLTPQLVVLPDSGEQAAAVLAEASRQDAAVIPWGGGTAMPIGNLPRRYDIALDITRLNAVVDHEPEDLTVVAQGGMRLRDLQDHLAKNGQYLPFDPPLPETATIGGILASNAGGPWRCAHGWPRDWTLGLKVALVDGNVTKTGGRVVKNVAGYDMTKLYLGSFGTLGVIVEAAFKLTVLPESRATVCAFFAERAAAFDTALTVYRRNLGIESLEVIRPDSTDVFAGTGIKQRGWALLVAAAGVRPGVERVLRETADLCKERSGSPVERLEGEAAERLWEGVRSLLLPPKDGARLLAKAALLPSQVEAFSGEMDVIAARHGLRMQSAAHAATGSVYSVWQKGKRRLSESGGEALLADLRKAASKWGAPVVVEGCPELLKSRIDVWGEPRGDFPLMRNIKGQLDPKGTLSPGRFLGRM